MPDYRRFLELYGGQGDEPLYPEESTVAMTNPAAAIVRPIGRAARAVYESALGRFVRRVALEPIIPAETVRKGLEKIAPSTAEPSVVGGALAGATSLSALLGGYQNLSKYVAAGALKPKPVAETVQKIAEFGPSMADVASLGGKAALIPVGMAVASLGKAGKAARAAEVAAELAKGAEAVRAGEITAEDALRFPGLAREAQVRSVPKMVREAIKPPAMDPVEEFRKIMGEPIKKVKPSQILEKTISIGEKAPKTLPFLERAGQRSVLEKIGEVTPAAPKIEPKLRELPPVKKEGLISKAIHGVVPDVVATDQLGRVGNFLRNQAELAYRPETRAAFLDIADSMEKTSADAARLTGEGIVETRPILETIGHIKDKDARHQVAKAIAQYVQEPESRDLIAATSPKIESLGEQVRGFFERARAKAVNAGIESGFIPDYWPRYHPRLAEAIAKYQKGEFAAAFDDARSWWADANMEIPSDIELDSIFKDEIGFNQRKEKLKGFSPHLEISREHDIPGFLGDVRDKNFKAEDVVHVIERYNAETAARTADAINNGPGNELFLDRVAKIPDRSIQDLVTNYRQRIVSPASITSLEGRAGDFASTLRNFNILSSLGRAAVQNAFQTAITSLPKTTATVGIAAGAKNYAKAIYETLGPGREAAYTWAEKIGVIQDDVIREGTSLAEGKPLSELASQFLDLTQFTATERWNNVVSAKMGVEYARELADMAWREPHNRDAVLSEVSRVFKSDPEAARSFLTFSELGGSRNLPQQLLDKFGYNLAVQTQFRFGPTHLPLQWLTPMGKTFYQFKTYGYNYAHFLKDDILSPAAHGDIGPLVTLAGTGITSGHLTRMARRALAFRRVMEGGPLNVEETPYEEKTTKGYAKKLKGIGWAKWLDLDKPDSPGWEVANDLATGVSLGLAGDVAAGIVNTGSRGVAEALAPPVAQKAYEAIDVATGRGATGGLVQFGLRNAPFNVGGVGNELSRRLQEAGVYRRPFLSPLIRGEKKFRKFPQPASVLLRGVGRAFESYLPDQMRPQMPEPPPADPGRMLQLYGGR